MSVEEQAEALEALTNAKKGLRVLIYRLNQAAPEEEIDEAADSAIRWITHFVAATLTYGMPPTIGETENA